ncbi:MAG: aminopeptidase [Kiritimatiellia bacterium]
MTDPRVTAQARILVRYCVDAREGQQIGVSGTSLAEPLLEDVCEELYRIGAFPALRMSPCNLTEKYFRVGKENLFKTLPSFQLDYARRMDATIGVQSEGNTRGLTGADPARFSALAKTMRPVRKILMRKRWVTTVFPTAAYAQDAEMSLSEFEDYVFAAQFADERDPLRRWAELHRLQERLIGKLKGADKIRIEGPDTGLTFSVKGRTFINSDGKRNMPSGEIFTGPVEDSVEGHIRFDFPVCVQGREVAGIRLVFKKGKVVEASADKNQAFLLTMLDSDPGARRLGELGIGTHPKINRFIRNILFDEKIGGTIHLALGQSYPETGGRNKSSLHWDLIRDLRKGGRLTVDGRVFQKDGRFV